MEGQHGHVFPSVYEEAGLQSQQRRGTGLEQGAKRANRKKRWGACSQQTLKKPGRAMAAPTVWQGEEWRDAREMR